jgi:hypothetical protein
MSVHTVVVDGPLALRMSRLRAAREAAAGRQIVTLPLLAARLGGGFLAPASQEVLLPSIRDALAAGGFEELGKVADLPGMPRAALKFLQDLWASGVVTADHVNNSRLRDLALLDGRVRSALPAGALVSPDLVAAAIGKVALAPRLLGPIEIDRIVDIPAVWRPLVDALCEVVPIHWTATQHSRRDWFRGARESLEPLSGTMLAAEVCAEPRSEVREALRWARALLAAGNVQANEIAIVAASPGLWDDAFLVLAREAELPLHFTHGIPALATHEGQSCAALADILLRGITQERVRLLFARLPRTPARDAIPDDWARGLRRGAALASLDHWRHALERARPERQGSERAERALLPLLGELSEGIAVADRCGALLLKGAALSLWQEALRMAPAQAVDLSLQALRVSDGRDPGNSVIWSPARHAAAMPRRFTRLLGLTGHSWPRRREEDPLLPDHLRDAGMLASASTPEDDRLHFDVIVSQSEGFVLSRSERSATGALQAPSPWWPDEREESVLGRNRIPEHAFSESDRLFARPVDAGRNEHVRSSRACWRDWHDTEHHTAHDGRVRPDHHLILSALSEVQSTTSLQRLLCDPLGYVWELVLHWTAYRFETEPLALDPRAFGELVHALISDTLRDLESKGGIASVNDDIITISLEDQAALLTASWPVARAVPPRLLWLNTIALARERALRALTDRGEDRTGRSWTEVAFGYGEAEFPHPWISSDPVPIGGTGLTFRGRIDRVDLDEARGAATITDYKTGTAPAKAVATIFDHGAELQRVFYGLAVGSLLLDVRRVTSRLTYLAEAPARSFGLSDEGLHRAIDAAIGFTAAGAQILRGGMIAPGRPRAFFDQLSLALPADPEAYRRVKQRLFAQANARLDKLWSSA